MSSYEIDLYSFSPKTSVYYLAHIKDDDGNDATMRIEFTNESIPDDERMLGCEAYECWDKEENRYIYHFDEYGNHTMKTKTIDGDSIEIYIESISILRKITNNSAPDNENEEK